VTQNIDPPCPGGQPAVVARQLADTPIRHRIRAPGKIATVFAVESFTDELAAAARVDPVAFRRRRLTDPRALAVIDQAASMIGWEPRPLVLARRRAISSSAGASCATNRTRITWRWRWSAVSKAGGDCPPRYVRPRLRSDRQSRRTAQPVEGSIQTLSRALRRSDSPPRGRASIG
jgi:hypothetical protein